MILIHSLSHFSYVWPHKGEILKNINDLMKLYGIKKQRIKQHSNFEGRNRSINRFARGHTSPSKDVENILMLS
jgi:hypothetical protein